MLEQPAMLIDRLLDDPPAIHAMDRGDDPELGAWSTDRDCYLLLAESATRGSHTLETGSGLSTIVLAAVGAQHTCITPTLTEKERILRYCADHDIDTSSLTFEIGFSDEVLPRLSPELTLDLALIDGNHGYPTPVIDWYYVGGRMRPGGLLVLDDVQLPAVAHLCALVDRDPRWEVHRRTGKWIAYRRITPGDLRQEWVDQPFYRMPGAGGLSDLPGRVARRIRRWRHPQSVRSRLSSNASSPSANRAARSSHE
jgi:predicted O-methyltransferase YrrM